MRPATIVAITIIRIVIRIAVGIHPAEAHVFGVENTVLNIPARKKAAMKKRQESMTIAESICRKSLQTSARSMTAIVSIFPTASCAAFMSAR